ncbi:MAG: ankyrin repeat domain-containing protein [Aestuariivita sp.]|nr:ankyrin repeat domain-containing protein [Aestuariivita sp.]
MRRITIATVAALLVMFLAMCGSAQAGQSWNEFFAQWWAENNGDEPLPWWATPEGQAENEARELEMALAKKLKEAVRANDVAAVNKAVQDGAPANVSLGNGCDLIDYAAQRGYTQVFSILMDAGADVGLNANGAAYWPLSYAAYNGHLDIVQILLSRAPRLAGVGDVCGYTIHRAVKRGHADIVRALLDTGEYPSYMSSTGLTPLDMAECTGQTQIAKMVRDAGGIRRSELGVPAGSLPLEVDCSLMSSTCASSESTTCN